MTSPDTAGGRRGWLHPSIVGAAVLAVAAGYALFGVTVVLGDVARTFGEAQGSGDIAEQAGLAGTTLGIGLAVVRLAGLGALPATSLADRLGRRRLLLVLVAIGLTLTVLSALSPGYWVFIAVVAAVRPLLSAANTIVGIIAAEETTAADRSKAIAFVAAAYSVGGGVVAVVHGTLTDVLGFRGVLAMSAILLAALPFVARFVEEPPIFSERATPSLQRLGAVRRELRPRLVLVAGLAAAVAVVTGPAFTFLFVYGENVLDASPAYMSGLIVVAGPTGLLGLLAGRWAADQRGRRVTSAISMAILALGAAITYSGTVAAMTGGYLVTILAAAAFGPPTGALLAEVFPTSGRATASGWAVAAGVTGSVIGLATFGVLSDLAGSFPRAAAMLFLPMGPLGVLYFLLPETRGMELDEAVPAGHDEQP